SPDRRPRSGTKFHWDGIAVPGIDDAADPDSAVGHGELGIAGAGAAVAFGKTQQPICAADGAGALRDRAIPVLFPRPTTAIPDRWPARRHRFYDLSDAAGGAGADVWSAD